MADARNHHFVSQCYLKGFAEKRSKDAKLHVWDAKVKRHFSTIPRNVAAWRDFNRVDTEGQDPNALETALGTFEADLDAALGRIIAARSIADDEDFSYLMNFVCLVLLRHPNRRDILAQFMGDVMHKMMDLALATKERWDAQMARAAAEGVDLGGEVPYEDLRAFIDSGEYEIKFDRSYINSLEFKNFDRILPILAQRQWTLFRTDPDRAPFITSDNPCVLRWNDGRPEMPMNSPGLGLRNTMLLVPVSRGLAIMGAFEGDAGEHDVDPAMVAGFNSYQIGGARQQIYAPNAKFRYMMNGESALRGAGDLLKDWRPARFDPEREPRPRPRPRGVW